MALNFWSSLPLVLGSWVCATTQGFCCAEDTTQGFVPIWQVLRSKIHLHPWLSPHKRHFMLPNNKDLSQLLSPKLNIWRKYKPRFANYSIWQWSLFFGNQVHFSNGKDEDLCFQRRKRERGHSQELLLRVLQNVVAAGTLHDHSFLMQSLAWLLNSLLRSHLLRSHGRETHAFLSMVHSLGGQYSDVCSSFQSQHRHWFCQQWVKHWVGF